MMYLYPTLLSNLPQPILKLIYTSYCVTPAMEIYPCSILAFCLSAFWIQNSDWNRSMRASHSRKFYSPNGMLLVFWDVVETKDLKMLSPLSVKVFVAAKMKRSM